MSDHDAKLCPACGRAVKVEKTSCHWNCRHVFSGDEVGANPEHFRMKTEPRVLSDDQIDIHLAALSGERKADPSAQQKDVEYFRENVSGCALGAGIVVLIAAIACVLARLGVLKGSGWTSGDWAAASIVTALLVIALAAWYSLYKLHWLRRGPDVATPQELVKTFYSELGVGHAKGSVGRAWVCLDPVAQAGFKSVDGLEVYRESRMGELGQYALRATEHVWSNHRPERPYKPLPSWSMTRGEPTVQAVSERVAEATFNLSIKVSEDHTPDDPEDSLIVCYGILELPQCKTLLKVENRWHLTSGTLDGPESRSSVGDPSPSLQLGAPA